MCKAIRMSRGLVFLMAIGVPICTPVARGMDLVTLSDICRAMEDSIATIQVEYDWDVVPPMIGKGMLVPKGATRQKLMARRPFLEDFLYTVDCTLSDERGNSHSESIWTSCIGGTMRYFQKSVFPTDGNSPERRLLVGSISTQKPEWPHINLTPIGFSVLRLSYDVDKEGPLSERLHRQNLTLLHNEESKVNGFKTISVDLLGSETKTVYIKVHFAVDYGYSPVKYIFLKKADTIAFVVDVNSLEKVSNGLWFPSSGTVTILELNNRMDRYRATSPIIVNGEVKNEAFAVQFPAGTAVSDQIRGKEYVVKPTSEQLAPPLPAK